MISREEVAGIARLSKLFIDESEINEITDQMGSIIEFANKIQEANSNESNFRSVNEIENALREDKVEDSFDRELILKNSSDTKDGYFCIKKSK